MTPTERQTVTTTCLILEEEYKQAIRQGEIKPPSGSSNDERALQALAKTRPGYKKNERTYKEGKDFKDKDKEKAKRKTCSYCKKLGHTVDVCRKKASDNTASPATGNAASTSSDTFFLLAHQDFALHIDASAIILDSGASTHMTGSLHNLTDIKPCVKNVTVANGATVPATSSGTMSLITASGNTLILSDVLHVPGMFATLLSIPTIVAKDPDSTRVTFSGSKYEISLHSKIIAIGTISEHGKMYLLDAQTSMGMPP